MTIRARISLLIGSLLTLVIAATGTALYVSERVLLLEKMEESRQGLIRHFAQSCRDAIVMHDDLAAINAAESVSRSLGVTEAFCADGKNRIFAHSQMGRIGQNDDMKGPVSPDSLRLVRQIAMGEGPSGRAVILFSRGAFDQTIREALKETGQRIAVVTGAALFLGMLGAFVLARSLTRPIQRIAKGTHEISQGRLDHRIQLPRKDELGSLAQDFNHMAEKLGELDQMKNDFVSNVSHELRSPLGAIESYVNLITDDLRNARTHNTMDHLNIVRNNATRLRQFVNDILDVSKIEARGMEVVKEKVNVLEMFSELIQLFGPKAQEKAIHLAQESVDPGLAVNADPDKLTQVLTNIVSNALKFTPMSGRVTLTARGGVTSAVDPRLPNGQFVSLAVIDTGPGIAAKDMERIFNRFEQVAEAREEVHGQKGTGLGLPITRGLVEIHGGKVMVDSEVGRGSRFTVYLPEEV
ncbi:MAG: HAMP domain-containing histidine kinase [Elusimicrobia bacterium]|nr:HAMP domain-containing histidine kinase [Elusimicrobiota bacterium]